MKNYISHKGYIGTVEFSAEDEVFFGKVQGLNDLVTFEGTSVKELKKAFKEAVEDYLNTCKILNKEPNKTFKGTFNVRVPVDLHKETAMLAVRKGLKLNDVVKEALVYVVKHEDAVLNKEKLILKE